MYTKRIEIITNHFDIKNNFPFSKQIDKINIKELKLLIDSNEESEIKNKTRQFISNNNLFKENYIGLNNEDYRALVYQQIKSISMSGLIHFKDVSENIYRYGGLFEILSSYNHNICAMLSVHYTLFAGTLLYLGTSRHEKYIEPSNSLEIMGCFSMTELGHGSNVRGIETTAHFDKETQEFIIHSPTPSSQKFWIGGAYLHASHTTIFANLIINNRNVGVHAFIVELRNQKNGGLINNGIIIKDCGHKQGLNGIDNGQIQFIHHRIPRENLLNKFSDVDENGNYKSIFNCPNKNFAATMSPFIAGRLLLAKGCSGAVKTCLSTAIEFSFERKQFGPTLENELPIITLPSQQLNLMKPLARTIIYDLYVSSLTKRLATEKQSSKSIHAHLSAIKAMYSWFALKTFQICRESCGGQGYRSVNGISEFKNDCEMITTFEGDNTVLMQQLVKYLLSKKSKPKQHSKFYLDGGDPKLLLFNFDTIKELFKIRQEMKLKELKLILSNSNEKPYFAFNNSIQWVIKLGISNTNKRIFNNAYNIFKKNNISPLSHLLILDSLVSIEEDLAWFLSNNLISPSVANSIPHLIQDLCFEITNVSKDIILSLDIPLNCKPPSKDLISDLF
ncbi:hypothetical protein ACTA71_001371 [Dictyostelium dimigraforme]